MYPVLLSLGPVKIHAYGFFLAVAFLCGMWMLVREGKRAGFKPEDMVDLTVFIIVLSIIGSRVLYIILKHDEFLNATSMLKIYQGGMSYHGGAVGGFLAVAIFARRRKVSGWRIIDAGMPAFIVGAAIARIGCFLNGCCYGVVTSSPLGVVFPSIGDNMPHHPVQLYDFTLHMIFLIIIFQLRRFKKRDGDMFAFYLMGYAILRAITEHFRSGATAVVAALGLTQAQWASVAMFTLGLALFLLRPIPLPPAPVPAPAPAKKSGSGQTPKSNKKKNKGNRK